MGQGRGTRGDDAMRRTMLLGQGLLLAALSWGCGDDDGTGPQPGDELDVKLESAHYVYRWSGTDPVGVDTLWQERWHAWLLQELALEAGWKIEYRKYRDAAHLKRVTGHDPTGFAETAQHRFHTTQRLDNHEATHVLWVELVGRTPTFFNEGVAVAYHGDPIRDRFDRSVWNGEDIHVVAGRFVADGDVPSLDALLDTNDFWDHAQNTTYPVAGSFVRWLVDQRGIEAFKSFARDVGGGTADPSTVRTRFREAYGEELGARWADWEAFVTDAAAGGGGGP